MRRQIALGLVTLAAVCPGLTGAALAAPQEIACTWRAPVGGSADSGAKEAGEFYSRPDELAYFRLNPESEKAENADPHKTQSIIFPVLSLFAFSDRYRITVREPNIAGLRGRKAAIHIDVNRYSLRSTMILEMSEKGGDKLFAFWLREGQCFKKEL